MSKKTILIFFLGFMTSAVVLGGICLIQRSSPKVSDMAYPVTIPAQRAITKQSPIPVAVPIVAEEVAKEPVVPAPQTFQSATETAVFKFFIASEPDAHSVVHEVKTGDTLTGISKKYHVTIDLVRRVNRIQGDRLILGSRLKIPTYKLSVVIDKSQNFLILKGDEEVLKTYVVSTGVNNSTPVGVFKITDKLIHPTWYKSGGQMIPYGDPANLLGTRWMGLTKKGYGIHGTLEPSTLGQQVTDGCVRMKNEDVEELYGFLTPGTEVTIVD